MSGDLYRELLLGRLEVCEKLINDPQFEDLADRLKKDSNIYSKCLELYDKWRDF